MFHKNNLFPAVLETAAGLSFLALYLNLFMHLFA